MVTTDGEQPPISSIEQNHKEMGHMPNTSSVANDQPEHSHMKSRKHSNAPDLITRMRNYRMTR